MKTTPNRINAKSTFDGTLTLGDAVRWYVLSADEIIVQETGLGIVTMIKTHPWPVNYMTYHVLCSEGKLRIFSRHTLKFLF